MGQDVRNDSRVCRTPPGPPKDLNQLLKPRTIFMAVSLTLILTTTSLVYYLIQPPIVGLWPVGKGNYAVRTPHSAIAIDGDANFSDTALLEGWPGDGSLENPFIIDGLYIDLGGEYGNCISISNTRASFTISNCNLTGARGQMMGVAGAGICLDSVTNGELVNNACNNNSFGILLCDSSPCTMVNNTCNSNWNGIFLVRSNPYTVSDYNTVANNTCISNGGYGIYLSRSNHSTVTDNTCNSNQKGITLRGSDHNTVANNTCNNNNKIGIYLYESDSNMVVNNTCLGNPEYDIYIHDSDSNTLANNIIGILNKEFVTVVLLLIGLVGIIVLGAVLTTRLESTSDVVRNKKIQLNNGLKDN